MLTVQTRRSLVLALWIGALGLGSAEPLSAQVLGRTDSRQVNGGAGYYINALPNEPTIRVYVRGDTPRTGIYDLGAGFDVESLIALAGGPTAADLDPRDPSVFIRLYRGEGTDREVTYEGNYLDLIHGRDPAPSLMDGDMLEVETLYERGVYVWGAVRNPGYFEVGPDVDAIRLLAIAGGPQGEGARASDVVNDATIIIVRPNAGVIYQASLEDFVFGTDVPALADGDALQVEVIRRNRFTFRDGLTIVGSVAAVILAVLRVSDAVSGN